MKRAAAKIVPKLLNFELRMDIVQEMLTTFNEDPDLLKKVTSGDESWLYSYGYDKNSNGSIQKSQNRKKHIKIGHM